MGLKPRVPLPLQHTFCCLLDGDHISHLCGLTFVFSSLDSSLVAVLFSGHCFFECMDALHRLDTLTLTELFQILLAVVLELFRRFGFQQPGVPPLPEVETFCLCQCSFCALQCRRNRGHRGRHRCVTHWGDP